MLKVVEQAVAEQLHEYLADNKLLPHNQSVYRKYRSMETALLRIWSDAMTAADCLHVTLLGPIDLSVEFHCVEHSILLQQLQVSFGLEGTVLTGSAPICQTAHSGSYTPASCWLFGRSSMVCH